MAAPLIIFGTEGPDSKLAIDDINIDAKDTTSNANCDWMLSDNRHDGEVEALASEPTSTRRQRELLEDRISKSEDGY
ncbi:hypothetical protein OCU04_000219 [Sclerotinia nivalis]|uniref:Uncharacterized protein n=1 Tax=Sclerotinia nivalis TaxID=352851 RepID=A0A9X0AWP4_9HELO|nr:hypothetical protein OCU04_000219 [Sclerotinia nivalis]